MLNVMIINSTIPQILNRIPPEDNKKTFYELWKGHKPRLSYFRVWGSLAKIEILEPKKEKIRPKAIDIVFV